jgi:hypothetical protein
MTDSHPSLQQNFSAERCCHHATRAGVSDPLLGAPALKASRLVFIDETAVTTKMTRLYGRAPRGERLVAKVFWRIDTPHRLMVKGLWGRGTGDVGHINDEDWGLGERDETGALVAVQPYQNTFSDADSTIRYFTIDVGYNWLTGAGYKLSPFVGYNYFRQEITAFGITFVNFSPPQPDPVVPAGVVPLQQFATWDSLRLGTAADLWLTPRLRLAAEAAWLPYVHLTEPTIILSVPGRGPARFLRRRGTAQACSWRQRSPIN